MMPIPGVAVSTPYGKRGSYWSCQEDSNGNGIHTGVDFACDSGTDVHAPIGGQIRHRSYGSSFGNHQFAISPDAGEPFADGEVFFAHMTSRPTNGAYVKAGDYLGNVGAEGNVSGPHLHMEYHADTKGEWSCSVIDDPQPVLDWGSSDRPDNPNDVEPGDVAIVITDLLNGRDQPSSDGAVVEQKPYGATFAVQQVVDGWASPDAPTTAAVAVPRATTSYLIGIDVSSNNSSNWEDDSGWDYCWVKATEGGTYKNPEYARQLGVVRERGALAGHYHWLNSRDIDEQVAWFTSQSDVRPGELIAVDWEDSSKPSCEMKDEAIRKLQAAFPDNKVGLYCNRDWWVNRDECSNAGDYLWIANYNGGDDPGIEANWVFWQYTSSPYDKNRGKFADLDALKTWAGVSDGGSTPPLPITNGTWYSTEYLFPQVKPDPTNPNGVASGDEVEVTASALSARVLPGGPQRVENGEPLSRPEGYTFDVKGALVDGWASGGSNWYSSDYLIAPTPPAKPGWKSTPHKVLSMDQVPGSVSYLQGVMHVNAVHSADGDWDSCWIIAQDYDNAGNIRFLLYSEGGTYQNWFQVNGAGHGQTFYAYRSTAGNLYVWCGEDAAYRHKWASGKKVSKTSGSKMDYKGARPMGGFNDRVAFRDASDTKETFYLFDRTDFTDGTNKTTPLKKVTVSKRTDRTQQSYGATNDRVYRIYGSTNETPGSSSGKHSLDVWDWQGNLLLDRLDLAKMYRSGADENEPEGVSFVGTPGAILCGMREGPASASKRDYVIWEMTNLP